MPGSMGGSLTEAKQRSEEQSRSPYSLCNRRVMEILFGSACDGYYIYSINCLDRSCRTCETMDGLLRGCPVCGDQPTRQLHRGAYICSCGTLIRICTSSNGRLFVASYGIEPEIIRLTKFEEDTI